MHPRAKSILMFNLIYVLSQFVPVSVYAQTAMPALETPKSTTESANALPEEVETLRKRQTLIVTQMKERLEKIERGNPEYVKRNQQAFDALKESQKKLEESLKHLKNNEIDQSFQVQADFFSNVANVFVEGINFLREDPEKKPPPIGTFLKKEGTQVRYPKEKKLTLGKKPFFEAQNFAEADVITHAMHENEKEKPEEDSYLEAMDQNFKMNFPSKPGSEPLPEAKAAQAKAAEVGGDRHGHEIEQGSLEEIKAAAVTGGGDKSSAGATTEIGAVGFESGTDEAGQVAGGGAESGAAEITGAGGSAAQMGEGGAQQAQAGAAGVEQEAAQGSEVGSAGDAKVASGGTGAGEISSGQAGTGGAAAGEMGAGGAVGGSSNEVEEQFKEETFVSPMNYPGEYESDSGGGATSAATVSAGGDGQGGGAGAAGEATTAEFKTTGSGGSAETSEGANTDQTSGNAGGAAAGVGLGGAAAEGAGGLQLETGNGTENGLGGSATAGPGGAKTTAGGGAAGAGGDAISGSGGDAEAAAGGGSFSGTGGGGSAAAGLGGDAEMGAGGGEAGAAGDGGQSGSATATGAGALSATSAGGSTTTEAKVSAGGGQAGNAGSGAGSGAGSDAGTDSAQATAGQSGQATSQADHGSEGKSAGEGLGALSSDQKTVETSSKSGRVNLLETAKGPQSKNTSSGGAKAFDTVSEPMDSRDKEITESKEESLAMMESTATQGLEKEKASQTMRMQESEGDELSLLDENPLAEEAGMQEEQETLQQDENISLIREWLLQERLLIQELKRFKPVKQPNNPNPPWEYYILRQQQMIVQLKQIRRRIEYLGKKDEYFIELPKLSKFANRLLDLLNRGEYTEYRAAAKAYDDLLRELSGMMPAETALSDESAPYRSETDESIPADYRPMVSRYFKLLSEG